LPSPGELGKQVIEYDSYYLSINNGLEDNYWKFFVHKISKSGDSLDLWKMNADTNAGNFVWSPLAFVKKGNNNYVVSSTRDTSNGDNKIKGLIAKFNNSYTQVLDFKNYYYEAYTKIGSLVEDDYHLVCGVTKGKTSGKVYFSVIKTDTNGNILWEKNYNDSRNLFNTDINGITKTHDKGYLLWTNSWNNNTLYGNDIDSIFTVYIKIDSIGNEQWRHRIGRNKTENNGTIPVQLADSSFILTWSDKLLNGYQGHEHLLNDSSTLYIARIGKSGTMIWQKSLRYFLKDIDTAINSFYSDFYPYDIWQLKMLKDGNLGIVGSTVGHGFVLKINGFGNPIWYRKYYPLQLPPMTRREYSENGIVGMIETSDGGFLLNGWSWYKGFNLPPWDRHSGFIYKTDKYGCITEGCYKQDKWYKDRVQKMEDSLQVIRDSIADALNKSNKGLTLLVYPNPTLGNLTIKVPASYNFNSSIQVQIYDSRSRLILRSILTNYTTTLNLSISKGVYLIKFTGSVLSENHKIVVY
jgi:hypothetical protein